MDLHQGDRAAIEAQRRRIAADVATLGSEPADPEADDVAEWVRVNSVSIEEPDRA